MRSIGLFASLLVVGSCNRSAESTSGFPPADSAAGSTVPFTGQPNVLVVVTDDQGVDQVAGWGVNDTPPATPTIDGLLDAGLRFNRAWATPLCSSSRAALLTGRHGRRTLLGGVIEKGSTDELRLDELTLAEALGPAGYATSAVGKWHLSSPDSPTSFTHPNEQGFDWFSGSLSNLGEVEGDVFDGIAGGYHYWRRVENGAVEWSEVYATRSTTEDALARLAAMPEPWFMYVPFHAGHSPFSRVPDDLDVSGFGEGASQAERYQAVIEAMDIELGRLLDGLGEARERTVVIFVSDNGTTRHAYEDDERTDAKNTPLEGGIRVPLVVSGPGIPAGESTDALVHLVDIFATVVDLAGVDVADLPTAGPVDGVSFVPVLREPEIRLREWVYTEKLKPNGERLQVEPTTDWRIARDDRFKLVDENGEVELYDMHSVKGEGFNMLTLDPVPADALAAHERLSGQVEALVQAMNNDP